MAHGQQRLRAELRLHVVLFLPTRDNITGSYSEHRFSTSAFGVGEFVNSVVQRSLLLPTLLMRVLYVSVLSRLSPMYIGVDYISS